MLNDKQLEKRRRQLLKTAYLAAVLAGCTISTASYAQTTREWEGDSVNILNGNTEYNSPNNWSGSAVPGSTDRAVFGTIANANSTVDIGSVTTVVIGPFTTTAVLPNENTVDQVYFSSGGNAQEFNVRINSGSSLTVNGNSGFGSGYLGVLNDSGLSQTFNVNGGTQLLVASNPVGSVGGGTLNFDGNSTITNVGTGSQVFINTTGNTYGSGTVNFNGQSSAGDENVTLTNETGGTTNFNNSSNAGSANIVNQNGGHTAFNSTDATEFSSADNATITNSTTGDTTFNGYATAGSATITNNDGGVTTFNDDTTASTATITNNANGVTYFDGNSDAYSATITNTTNGATSFYGTASADKGDDDTRTVITNSGTDSLNEGATTFSEQSTAGEARIINNAFGRTDFSSTSDTVFTSAGNARITNNANGNTNFYGYSTAGDAFIVNNADGATNFNGNSNAGTALIVNRSGGTTVFNDNSQGNGATIINRDGGTLEINAANVSIGHVRGAGDIALTGSLTLNSEGTDNPTRNDVISGVISGSGGLTKEGENIVRLTGNNTYTGDTTINNGVLSIIGEGTDPLTSTAASQSNINIGVDGELRGTGIINGNLANNGGRLDAGDALGNRYAPLLVNNFTSTADSTFVARVHRTDSSLASNYIGINNVAGVAALDGEVEVHVDQSPGTLYLMNNQFTLVTGLNVTGTFTGVDEANSDIPDYLSLVNSGGIVDGLSYEPYAAYLTLRRNSLDDLIDGVNLTRNQRALYNSLNNADFDSLNADQDNQIDRFIFSSASLGSSTAASLLSGDALTAYQVAAQGASNRFNQRLISQIFNQTQENDEYASIRTPRLVYTGTKYRTLLAQGDGLAASGASAVPVRRSSIWATIARAKEDTDSDGNGPGFDARATEYQVGINRNISARTVVGLSIGKSDGDINVDNRAASGDLDTTSFGAYIRHDNDNLYFSGLLSYSRHDIDSRRVTSIFDSATADYDARTISLWGEVGKKVERGSLAIEPHISLKLSNTKQDSFSESGLDGLDVNSEKYNTRRLGLGVRVATNSATARFRPYGFIGYEREFGDERAELTSSLAGLSAFRVRGSDLGKNIWALRLGTDARISDRFSVVGEIGASWRKNQDSRYIYGGVKYGW